MTNNLIDIALFVDGKLDSNDINSKVEYAITEKQSICITEAEIFDCFCEYRAVDRTTQDIAEEVLRLDVSNDEDEFRNWLIFHFIYIMEKLEEYFIQQGFKYYVKGPLPFIS